MPVTGNAARPKDQRIAKGIVERRIERERRDLEAVMSSAEGRRWTMRVLRTLGVFKRIGQGDGAGYQAGLHDAGIAVLEAVQSVRPTALFDLHREEQLMAQQDEEAAAAMRKSKRGDDDNDDENEGDES